MTEEERAMLREETPPSVETTDGDPVEIRALAEARPFLLALAAGDLDQATASARGNLDLTHKQADRPMYEHKAARRNMTNGSGK